MFGTAVYPNNRALLRASTASKLARAAEILARDGMTLVVWDAWRPPTVQRLMWNLLPDPRFVAHPRFGSRHSRGAAVDVTLADADGRKLPMPCEFDEFSERAHAHWPGGTDEERDHRDLLRQVMERAGFRHLAEEWWHFDDRDWRRFPVCYQPHSSGSRR